MTKRIGIIFALLSGLMAMPLSAQEVVTDELLASADVSKGKRVFLRCRACHSLGEGEKNKVGPNLWGVFGSQVGIRDDFNYSNAVQEADFIWTPDQLNEWLIKPKDFLPGNRMAFVGLNREADRVNLIAYLIAETKAEEEAPAAEEAESGEETSESPEEGAEAEASGEEEAADAETSEEAAPEEPEAPAAE